MATPRITIPELPPVAALDEADEMVVQNGLITKRMPVGSITAPINTAIADHVNDVSDAHQASAIGASPNLLPMTGTNVQLQLAQASSEIVALRTAADESTTHIADPTDAHDASAISVTPLQYRTGTNVQAVLAELSTIVGDGEMIEVGAVPPPDTEWLWADTTEEGTSGGGPGGSGVDAEGAVDAVAAALVEGAGIDIVYDDTANTITVAATSAGGTTILSGTTPPIDTTGAVGNYYEDTANGILYGPKVAGGYGAAQTISVASTPITDGGSLYIGGIKLQFVRPGRVTGIRYRRMNTSSNPLTFDVWRDADQTSVAQVTHAGTTTGQFTVTFPTPVPVGAVGTYTFTVSGTTASNVPVGNAQTVTDTADCKFVEYRYSTTARQYPETIGGGPGSQAYYVEPVYEPDTSWPVTVRNVAVTDPELVAIAGLKSLSNTLPYFTGSGTAATTPFTVAARDLLDDSSAASMRTTLGVPGISRTITVYSAVSNTGTLGDAGCYLRFTGTNPTYTVPPNASVAFPVGTQIDGIGTATAMTIIQGSGVTITKARTLVTLGTGSGWTLIKTGTDTWDLHGDCV